jgi:hypothetical protein
MPQVAIEYMILIPVLIAQIFIFPFAANAIMNTWVDQRRNLELEGIAGHLGSSLQQLYFTMNRAPIPNGCLTANLDTPPTVDNYYYNITLRDNTTPSSSAKIMEITLTLIGAHGVASSIVTFGENAAWQNGITFKSNVTALSVTMSGESILLSFDGGAS